MLDNNPPTKALRTSCKKDLSRLVIRCLQLVYIIAMIAIMHLIEPASWLQQDISLLTIW